MRDEAFCAESSLDVLNIHMKNKSLKTLGEILDGYLYNVGWEKTFKAWCQRWLLKEISQLAVIDGDWWIKWQKCCIVYDRKESLCVCAYIRKHTSLVPFSKVFAFSFMSVCHKLSDSHSISDFPVIKFVMVIWDPWSLSCHCKKYYDSLKAGWWLAFLVLNFLKFRYVHFFKI